jgi:hypothetical protein
MYVRQNAFQHMYVRQNAFQHMYVRQNAFQNMYVRQNAFQHMYVRQNAFQHSTTNVAFKMSCTSKCFPTQYYKRGSTYIHIFQHTLFNTSSAATFVVLC